MDPLIKLVLDENEEHMQKSIEHFKIELVKIRAGKASPDMIASVTVDYYGSQTPVNQVATVTVADARTLAISPWEKHMIPIIEKAIRDANLGFNPQSDGDMVRIPIPMLTEERRQQLVKQAKAEAENAKIALRSIRKSSNDQLKQLQKDGTSEDEVKTAEKKVQEAINEFGEKVDAIMKEKETQIMTV